MDDADDSQGGDAAAEAFEAMRGELALLRRAVEGLAAERGAIEIPDYTETLGRMQQGVDATADWIAVINDVIARSPALAMTPEQMAQRIAAAGNAARREDQRTLAETRAGLDQAARQLTGLVASARRGDEQNRWLAGVGVTGALVGAALWVALAGPIARAMPESWQWPERMAARTLDRSQWDAGQRLMASAASASWADIVAGDRIITANRAAIERCRKAAKVGKPARCRIEVPTAGS